MTRSFDVFFDLRLNKRLIKQSWGWWFETLSRSLWRHCNGQVICYQFISPRGDSPLWFDVCRITGTNVDFLALFLGNSLFPSHTASEVESGFKSWYCHDYTQSCFSGAALHIHDGTMVELVWIVSNLTYHPLCYMCRLTDGSINLGYYDEPPATEGIISMG